MKSPLKPSPASLTKPVRRRITLVICHMRLGGAQRVISAMANYWNRQGCEVTLMSVEHGELPTFYPLDEGVRHVDFQWGKVFAAALPKLRWPMTLVALRFALQRTRPHVIVTFLNTTNIRVLAATCWSGIPVIACERNDPHQDLIGKTWERWRDWLYPTAAAVVAQTQSAMAYFSADLRRQGAVIPNWVLPPPLVRRPGEKASAGGGRELIAMGRLAEQKGFDLLLEAFARVAGRHPDWRLTIWGEGTERARLEALVTQLGLADRVRLPGATQQPFEKYQAADLFVFSSRYEGFPNALCEAMACGLPVISFNCPSGPGEIIRQEVDGLLVAPGDVAALAATLARAMGDADLRARLAARAVEIVERFSFETVMVQWEALLAKHAKSALPAASGLAGDQKNA